jgi:hydroxymethylglutaryl-CoA lyase
MARKSAGDRKVTVFEVGPRDGLQNEAGAVAFEAKLAFISGLIGAGVKDIELGAFVRPDRVPQMADTDRVCEAVREGRLALGKARGWCLVPNRRGLERALAVGVSHIAVFTGVTDSFTQANIGVTFEQSLSVFKEVVTEARKSKKIRSVRAYLSTAFGCPYEGKVPAKKTLKAISRLADIGVGQISIGDTIGVATPDQMDEVMKPALRMLGKDRVAGHFHDTRGTALANALRSLELGVRTLDSSASGLGGCPYAPGASGNLATEDLVYMLEGLGMRTGIDLIKLSEASLELNRSMGRAPSSRYLMAFAAATRKG